MRGQRPCSGDCRIEWPCLLELRGRRRIRAAGLARRTAGLLKVDEDVVALDFDRKGRNVLGERRTERLAGAYVEQSLMQGTFDLAVLDETFRQDRQSVRANAVRCVDLAAEIIERERRAFELDAQHAILGNRLQ